MTSLRQKAEGAVRDLIATLPQSLQGEERQKATDIIESYLLEAHSAALIEGLRKATTSSKHVARACCGADQDMAHKLAREIENANTALIANLSGLR